MGFEQAYWSKLPQTLSKTLFRKIGRKHSLSITEDGLMLELPMWLDQRATQAHGPPPPALEVQDNRGQTSKVHPPKPARLPSGTIRYGGVLMLELPMWLDHRHRTNLGPRRMFRLCAMPVVRVLVRVWLDLRLGRVR